MNNRIYYTEHNSPDGLLYSGNGNEKSYEPYPLHEDQGNGRFKRYRIAPPQTESFDVLEKQLLDNLSEQSRLRVVYTELWENFQHYGKQNE
jgi:hypothetical protein